MYTRDAHGLIVVYDVTQKASLAAARDIVKEVLDACSDAQEVVVALVGNKSDLTSH